MTTLPQTTPIRLPRAGGNSQLAMPAGAPISTAGPAAPSFAMTGGDVWRVIRANMWLIIIMLMLSTVAGYFTYDYLAKHKSAYTTLGWVKMAPLESVDPLHPGPLVGDPVSMEIEKQTDIQRFKNQSLHEDLMKDPTNAIRQTRWWKETCEGDIDKAHEQLNQLLIVSPVPMSQFITVQFTTGDKLDCAVIVKAIIDRAILDQQSFIRAKFDADHERLYDGLNKYTMLYNQATNDIKTYTSQISAMGGGSFGRGGPKEMELSHDIQEQLTVRSEMMTADTAYNKYMEMKQNGQVMPRISEAVEQDPEVIGARQAVKELDFNLRSTEDAPQSQAHLRAGRMLEYYQQELDNLRAEKTAKFTAAYETEITNTHDTLHKLMDVTTEQINHLKTDLAEVANLEAAQAARREDAMVDRQFIKEYDAAIRNNEQMTENSLSGSLTMFEAPHQPTVPSFPKLATIMPVAIVVGLALSLGIAFLRELTDTTVRSPRDIVRVGQMSFLGMVPHESDDPQSSGARLPLVIFEAPHSIMAEQLRQVRTRLQHTTSMDTTRSILVTSPSPGDGKSTIAVNLAAGLALNGRRILLVDSNFRRPELHRIFGLGNEAGFADVLNDVNAFAQCVRETPVPNLSVMASGPKPSNPTELLESQLLLDFIERALEEYDHVIFDSGPMLFVSDAVALAPRVDGVITVVRARTSSRGVLQRMRDGLRAVKAEHLGVVLNGVRSQAGGYYGRSIKTYYEYQNAE
jgi:capsular exopolysaccharide synthesis family protein